MMFQRQPAQVLFACLVAATGCNESVSDLTDPNREAAVVTVESAAPALPADGAATTEIQVSVQDMAPTGPRTAAVAATAGTLLTVNDTGTVVAVPLDAEGRGQLTLRSPLQPGEAVVRVQYAEAIDAETVVFEPALPHRIVLTSSQFALRAGPENHIMVTAALHRTTGSVSPGRLVTFAATDTTGTARGLFSGDPYTGEGGTAELRLTAGDSDYRGPLTLVASADAVDGGVLADSTVVWVTDPPS